MFELVPAIIPKDYDDLAAHLARVAGILPTVQIDILDGKFVPEHSWPYGDEDRFARIVACEESLPLREAFFFEADLMIKEPEVRFDEFAYAGFGRIIVHAESTTKLRALIERAKELDVEIGIALGIHAPIEEVLPYLDQVSVVQCMGIEQIGYQGQPFDVRVVDKIAQIKEAAPGIIVSVDGGVSVKTAPILVAAGAERLVSGSALFGQEDVSAAVASFEHALHE